MNRILLVLLVLSVSTKLLSAQEKLSSFLQGNWKAENKNMYEHWDVVNDSCLRGFAYEVKNGHMVVLEYLDITSQNQEIVYTATVLNQNNGSGIAFTLRQTDSLTYSFENFNHDFPKKIIYKKQSSVKVHVTVSDGEQKYFSYYMIKQEAANE